MRTQTPKSWLGRLRHSEEGAVTIPALLWLPLFIMIMAASVEMGVLIIKQTLFDRGIDLTTRILRLGLEDLPSHEQLKRSICTNIAFIPDCMDRLAVEVFPVDTDTWTATNQAAALCVDSSNAASISPQILRGGTNQLMILRACLKIDTMMEVNPLAMALARDVDGRAALVSVTAFVNEPRPGS
ncbi:hypothetical protein CKO11_12960 [Rhodobacter sp. TJ_12]|uniref:TadE/TadG family type IV pilus assembly protein n=1 Tax=Rhodobacter sp. TJ_12 TaxID=2029399 RepID=UPI001CC0244E|nr:pilus assembly protein [Rhodobacter sp. TJ_12]MBZ4023368.1 hypothetical protein [Rhodobacter sp. TJ_12]